MYRVRSESPDRILLIELQDSIYYRQEKVFSDAEYDKCISLQRAIVKGQVLILDRKPEKDAGYVIPVVSVQSGPAISPIITSDNTSLFDYLKSLEDKIDQIKAPSDSSASSGLVELLTQKIEALEKKIQINSTPASTENIFKKLEEISAKFSNGIPTGAAAEKVKEELEEIVPQEIYVPNVRVEDGNSHINLKIRTIEKSSSVDSASEALRKLKEGK
jgi:phage shock protein A